METKDSSNQISEDNLELFLLTFRTSFDLNLESVFDPQLSSILVQYLTVEEIFLKLGMLNKNFNTIVNQLKQYKNLWVL
jgi:hypothetical protein